MKLQKHPTFVDSLCDLRAIKVKKQLGADKIIKEIIRTRKLCSLYNLYLV